MSYIYSIILFLIVLLLPVHSEGQSISGPEVKMLNNDLFISFSLGLSEKSLEAISNGMEKELRFYIDLFRVWKVWPDEFVLGRSYVKTVMVDPVKKEYTATSNDGSLLVEKRFRSLNSMLDWVVSFKDLKLTNVRELEPGRYFVRVTVESKVRNLPPVIGYFFVFVSENEFKTAKDSAQFMIEGSR